LLNLFEKDCPDIADNEKTSTNAPLFSGKNLFPQPSSGGEFGEENDRRVGRAG